MEGLESDQRARDLIWVEHLPKFLRQRFAGRSELQAVFSNTSWLFADQMVRLSVGTVVGIWVARFLGPTQFGQLSFAIAFAALFNSVAALGLNGIVVRDLVRFPGRSSEILGSALVLKLAGGFTALFMAVVLIGALRPADHESRILVTIIAIGFVIQAADISDLWFQSRVLSRFVVLARTGAYLIASGVRVALIAVHAPVRAFAYALLAESMLVSVGLIAVYKRRSPFKLINRPSVSRMKSLLHESWPLLLSGVAVMLYMRIDQLMIAQLLGEKEVGLYSAALRLSEVWYLIPTVVVGSVMPALTRNWRSLPVESTRKFVQLLSGLSAAAYVVAVIVSLASTFIMEHLYGPAYAGAGRILAVHVWTAVFVFTGVAASPWILNEGLTRLSLYRTICGACANILLNLFLIPRFGAVGAAWATIVSQFLSAYFSNLFFGFRSRELFWLQTRGLSLQGLWSR